jgi:hypothetical protein
MKPEEFELVERVGPEALARHPVWKTWRVGDRPRVLAWGVDPAALDAALQRFGYCGPEPLFPVLACERLPDRSELFVAARFELASGHVLPGYLLPPLAFGLFASEHEVAFNRSLPGFARRMADKLAAELGISPDGIFPIRWRSSVRGPEGEPLAGEIAAPW